MSEIYSAEKDKFGAKLTVASEIKRDDRKVCLIHL